MTIARQALCPLLLSLLLDGDALAEPPRSNVVGGEASSAGDHEAVVAVIYPLGGPLCTGTLVQRDVVVTAAHCLDPALHGAAVPSVTTALDVRGGDVKTIPGLSKHVLEEFDHSTDPPDELTRYGDIGILVLAEELDIEPLKIASPVEATGDLAVGATVEIVGYGIFARHPRAGGVKHRATARLRSVGTHELLISDPGDPQNCGGDSGGPALLRVGGDLRLAGIVSRSADRNSDCAAGSIHTRADVYSDWVHRTSVENRPAGSSGCSAGSPPPPGGTAWFLVLLWRALPALRGRRGRKAR